MSGVLAALMIGLLAAYMLVGAALAFNFWGSADDSVEIYKSRPWFLRPPGSINPDYWRGSGLFMLAFGGTVIGWLAISTWYRLPVVNPAAAVVALGGLGLAAAFWLVRLRRRQ